MYCSCYQYDSKRTQYTIDMVYGHIRMEKLVCILGLISFAYGVDFRVDPLVLINNQGLVRGHKATDGDYSIFLGIPYAHVDSSNPFGPSDEPEAFHELIHDAVDDTIICPQKSSNSNNIDCLSLNIYVPSVASSRNPLPVMAWFHGGNFDSGSANDFGVRNLVRHGILVVTINYRLGPYGFLCLDIPSVAGNQGLKDQYKALTWIRNNIASFGGNPYNVTIAGQDAGATSVLLHLYSSKEKYFHKVIAQSSTPQSEGMFVNGDVEAAIKLASYLGLNTSDTEQAIQFLSEISPDLVVAASADLGLNLKPCKERSFSGVDIFMGDDPYSMSNRRKVSNTAIMIGVNSKESSLTDDYYNSDPFYEKLKNHYDLDETTIVKLAKNIKHFYIGDKEISPEVASQLKDFESDFGYNHPAERTINNLLNEGASAIYEYIFSYVGSTGLDGAEHSYELNYLFDLVNSNTERDDEDQLIVDRITYLWTNFIKYGNPTVQSSELVPFNWPPVTEDTRPTMVIDTDIRIEGRVYQQRMAYWDLFYSMYGSYNYIVRTCHRHRRSY